MITIENMIEALSKHHYSRAFSTFSSLATQGLSLSSVKGGGGNFDAPKNDISFVTDISSKTIEGKTISTKQAYVAKKILSKNIDLLSEIMDLPLVDIKSAVEHPLYRNPPYQSTELPREVRYIGERKLAFRSKYSPQIKDMMKSLKSKMVASAYPYFNRDHNVWVVEVVQDNLSRVFSVISKLGFEFDEPTVQFLTDCENTKDENSNAVVDEDTIVIEVNNDEFLSKWVDILKVEEDVDARHYNHLKET